MSDANALSHHTNKHKEKIGKLQIFYLSYFLAKHFLLMVFKIYLFFNQYLVQYILNNNIKYKVVGN